MYTYSLKAARNHDDDDEEDTVKKPIGPRKPYQQYDQTFTAQHVHFYISEEFGAPENYTDLIHRINMAGPLDVIFVHLNTPGGRLDTGTQIINAMQNSAAKVVTVLDGVACSLGTLVFLAGDEMVVNDNCMMMFHNFRAGIVGKGQEITAQLEATVKWFESMARRIYIPFMAEDEFNKIVRGEDIWMQSAEIRKRLEKMVKLIDQQAQKSEKKKTTRTKRQPKTPKVDTPKS